MCNKIKTGLKLNNYAAPEEKYTVNGKIDKISVQEICFEL